jgi:hypothetical protein
VRWSQNGEGKERKRRGDESYREKKRGQERETEEDCIEE